MGTNHRAAIAYLRTLLGITHGYLACLQVNRRNGTVRSLGFWETEADLHRSAA